MLGFSLFQSHCPQDKTNTLWKYIKQSPSYLMPTRLLSLDTLLFTTLIHAHWTATHSLSHILASAHILPFWNSSPCSYPFLIPFNWVTPAYLPSFNFNTSSRKPLPKPHSPLKYPNPSPINLFNMYIHNRVLNSRNGRICLFHHYMYPWLPTEATKQ